MIGAALARGWRRLRTRRLMTAYLVLFYGALALVGLWLPPAIRALVLDAGPPGFDSDGIGSVELTRDSGFVIESWTRNEHPERLERLLAVVRSTPGVIAAGATEDEPQTLVIRDRAAARPPGFPAVDAHLLFVDETFADVMRLQLVAGRFFTAQEAAATIRPLVVDEEVAAAWGGPSRALGVEVDGYGNRRYRVVGVMARIPSYWGKSRTGPVVALPPIERKQLAHVVFRLAPGDREATLVRLYEAVAAQAPGWMPEITRHDFRSRALAPNLFTVLSVFFVALGALILGGALWLEVARRAPELGLRRALGATRARVRLQIGLEVTVQALWASFLGAALLLHAAWVIELWSGWARHRPAKSLDSELLTTLPIAAALLVLVVLVASWAPARHAGRVEPIAALRHD